jgi:hypothetical protein
MDSCDVLREAVNRVGAKFVAADMKLSSSLIYKWCQTKIGGDCGGVDNPLDRIDKICRITEDIGPVVWLCERFGGYFVENEEIENGTFRPLLKVTQEILVSFSELLEQVSKSIQDDGREDKAEAIRIRKEWEELKRVTESFVNACESGVYGDLNP